MLKLLTNKELIALNQDPLGLQAYVAQHGGIFTQKIHAEIHPEILGSDHCPVSIELISSEKTEAKNV
jgi:hypothetical protein